MKISQNLHLPANKASHSAREKEEKERILKDTFEWISSELVTVFSNKEDITFLKKKLISNEKEQRSQAEKISNLVKENQSLN
jgi:hypothetical protein